MFPMQQKRREFAATRCGHCWKKLVPPLQQLAMSARER
jgi:hypothetical protein